MTEPGVEAEETFVPWLRRGLGVGIGREGATAEGGRASIRVVVELERRVEPPGAAPRDDTQRAVVTLPMFGPADVTGLDPRAVLRVWPQPEVGDAESEFLPLVEFAEPDLPWRYTPAGAVEGRLRPWLCLLALAEGEFTLLPSGQGRSRTEVEIKPETVLPDLREAWAWAHVHVTEAIPGNPTAPDPLSAAIFAVHERAPSRVVARLLCARRLEARKRYTVVAVPTFNATGTADAWSNPRTDRLTLPVYHHWSFGTGPEGDFRTLALRLTMCTDMPATVGKRTVDLRGAAPRLHAFRNGAAVDTLGLGAALEPVPESTAPEAPFPVELVGSDPAARSLAALLNDLAPSILQSDAMPIVGPPAYGCWYLSWRPLPRQLPRPSEPSPSWIEALNLDVPHRIAAGVGTRVVQEQQQALMASAWAQLGSLRRVDEERRFSQVSREAGRHIYQRDVTPMSTESLLRFTAPVHGRVMAGPMTVRAVFEKSPIDPAVLSATWRRVARPRGHLGRRQKRDATTPPLLDRMNRGQLVAARPPALPAGLPTALDLLDGVDGDARKAVLRAGEGTSVLGQVILCAGAARGTAARLRQKALDGLAPRTPAELVEAIRTAPGGDSDMRDALMELAGFLGGAPTPVAAPLPVDLAALATTVRAAVDPSLTIPEAFCARLALHGDRVRPTSDDLLGPVVAYPEFPQPMYEPLRDLSPEWILPGLDRVPRNTVSLLRPNRAFIEAYLVGLNHEMSRELLWNTYPTDQRGTYFRRFWRTVAAEPGAQPRMDITEIHRWERSETLGGHPAAGAANDTVFLVRGDLIQRFPTAVFYAVHDPDGETPETCFPSFVGTMKPDVIFVGFPLSTDTLRETPPWYFAIQEPVTETRFHHQGTGAAGSYAAVTEGTAATVAAARIHTPVRLLLAAAAFLDGPPREPDVPALGAGEVVS
jgi:hypothetical protein